MSQLRRIPIVVWPILGYVALTSYFALTNHGFIAGFAFVLISLSMFGVYIDPPPGSKKSAIGDTLFRPLIGLAFIIVWLVIRCMWLFGLPHTITEDMKRRKKLIRNSI